MGDFNIHTDVANRCSLAFPYKLEGFHMQQLIAFPVQLLSAAFVEGYS